MILSLLLLTLIGPILGVSSSARSSPSDLADIYDRLQHPLTPEEEEFSLLNSGLQTSHGGVADRSIAVEPISSTDKHESSIHLPDSPSQFRGIHCFILRYHAWTQNIWLTLSRLPDLNQLRRKSTC
ncbi:hypothetical protein H4Q26_015460 [Puccinia striiformis f. sp. tritici PST-130]|nr:hypothetical protein H4Q26_015460 [Puccinia striiformis f. sp. tritici PST-130]